MVESLTYLNEESGERWVTIMHRHVKVDGDGNIIGGLGGKFNGKPLQHAADHLASSEGSKKNKVTTETSTKKIKQAINIAQNNPDLSSKELKDIFMKKLGMSAGMAAVYLHKVKKTIGTEKKDEPEEKKESPKPEVKPEKKEEPKVEEQPETKEKSAKKFHQALAIYKSMPDATSKEVQAKFKSQIGMSAGMAAVYYHKIKKQLGTVEQEKTEPKKDLHSIHQDYLDKEISNQEAIQLTAKHYGISNSEALEKWTEHKTQMKIDANKAKTEAEHKNVDDTIKNEYEKGMKAGDSLYYISQAIKKKHPDHTYLSISKKLSEYHKQAQEDAIANKGEEKASAPGSSKDADISNIVKKYYQTSNATDIVNMIQKKHKMSIVDAADAYLKHKNIHVKNDMEEHIDDLLKNKSDEEAYHHLSNKLNIEPKMAKVLWDKHPKVKEFNDNFGQSVANHYDKYNMGLVTQGQALKQLTDKHGVHFTKAEDAWAAHKNNVEADEHEATKLYNYAMNSGDEDSSKQTTYSDIKDKVSEHHGGSTVHYDHDNAIEHEHVKEYRAKVKVAEKTDAHTAFDPHDHLYHPNHYHGFFHLPQEVKEMSQAVHDYTSFHYDDINKSLRRNEPSQTYKKTIENIDKAFAHASARVKTPTMVYRGYTNKFANNLMPGDILEDKGYMSTANYLGKAEGWASSSGAVVHILLPKGANVMTVQHISAHPSESELIINRGAKLRIIKKEVRKNPYASDDNDHGVTLYAEYILPDESEQKETPKPKKKLSPLERLQKKAAEGKKAKDASYMKQEDNGDIIMKDLGYKG